VECEDDEAEADDDDVEAVQADNAKKSRTSGI